MYTVIIIYQVSSFVDFCLVFETVVLWQMFSSNHDILKNLHFSSTYLQRKFFPFLMRRRIFYFHYVIICVGVICTESSVHMY